ncbi:unnamed protein product, partial [Mesorhabditis spiculigera]
MLFMRVFVDYYGSNLRKILIFSDNIELPFQDFRGFLLALQMGEYRLLTSSTTQIPVCPYEYYDRCDRIFEEIFAKYPPIIGSYQKLAQDEFVRKHPYPLVAFAWLPGHRITSEYSTLTDRQFHSHVWVIRNVNIFPASLIFNKRVDRKLMERIDNAVITLLGALETVDLHYDPIYPPVSIQQLPTKTAFTLRQLSVIFYVLLGALGISLLALVVEINFSYLKLQLGRPKVEIGPGDGTCEGGKKRTGADPDAEQDKGRLHITSSAPLTGGKKKKSINFTRFCKEFKTRYLYICPDPFRFGQKG